MDAEQVAADLAKHEAVCAERWKTAFNRFDDIDDSVKRIESIIIAAAGAIIVGGAGLVTTMWLMHSQETTMELDYSKKDITKAPKIKKVKSEIPEGWELYEKRGLWHLKGDTHEIFTTKEEALAWLTN